MRLLFRALLNTLFPPLCLLCKAPIPDADELHLCAACHDTLSFVSSPLCPVCGLPYVTADGIDHLCGSCLATAPLFAAARAALVFADSGREMIHRFKYDRKVHLRTPLALLTIRRLETFIADCNADLLLPVPLHGRRLRERGFNQAVLLGARLARGWRLPFSRNNLRRIRWTEPQITLCAAERASNVRGAFVVHSPGEIAGRRVILLDDVYTTGSTVNECARTLLGAGADAVFVVTVARAIA